MPQSGSADVFGSALITDLRTTSTMISTNPNPGIQTRPLNRQKPVLITEDAQVAIKDLDTGEEFVFTLVHPDIADAQSSRVSVLTPLGRALLGHGAGTVVRWPAPSRLRRFLILSVLSQRTG